MPSFYTMQDWPFQNQIIDVPVKQDELIWEESMAQHTFRHCLEFMLALDSSFTFW
jgi:hypothetical protein